MSESPNKRARVRPAACVAWRCVWFVARLKLRWQRERSQLDILYKDIGVLKQKVLVKDIRDAINTMFQGVWRNDFFGTMRRAPARKKANSITERWQDDVRVVRTRTGVAILNDAYASYDVYTTFKEMQGHGLDVEYIVRRWYTRYTTEFDEAQDGKYFLYVNGDKRFNRGCISGVRLLNDEGRKQRDYCASACCSNTRNNKS